MEIAIKVIQFFMSLSLLVAIHEFGHFIMARIFKIRVEKFYIFFDPWFSLFKWKRGDTEYGVGWLPLGGYVKIAGMIDESMDLEQMQAPEQPWEFRAKPAWQRFMVMIAGVMMNVLLAMMIYSGIRYVYGESYMANEDVRWGYEFNEAAERMGFCDGDKIISIDGEVIDDVNDIRSRLLLTKDDRQVVVERGGVEQTFTIPFEQLLEMASEVEHHADQNTGNNDCTDFKDTAQRIVKSSLPHNEKRTDSSGADGGGDGKRNHCRVAGKFSDIACFRSVSAAHHVYSA
jgi:regulator of sigma E protease